MTTEKAPSSSKVADMYDEITTVMAKLWNGNLHYGYWSGPDDDSSFEEAVDHMTEQVIRRLDPRPGQYVLDAGCGIGSPALKLARDHPVTIKGISISPRQVALANERAGNATGLAGAASFEVVDAMSLPYPDGTFDGVLSLESMMHMPDKLRALQEIRRVLRPGGRLALADIARPTLPGDNGDGAPKAETSDETYSMVRIDEYGALLREAGLEPLEIADVSDRTRRSSRHFVAGAEACRDEYVRAIGAEEFERRLEEGRRLEWTPEIGYVLIAARRPEE
ncbi:methyltransferase domain-containing protein [Streptomyces sp. NPDC059900]|uniref:SAM-dependent methyltransferase n=1 Tax=Streptomyces sp. NPDC059900 TaxID=3155816 RepID=UPI0034212224